MLILIFLGLGSAVGFLAGLLGIGGGGLMVPVLAAIFLWQGIDYEHLMHLALGTSMAVILTTSVSSLLAHHRRKAVIWQLVIGLSPAVIVGAFGGTYLVSMASSQVLALVFALFMLTMSAYMFSRSKRDPEKKEILRFNVTLLSLGGLIIGVISSLVSIGGGSMTVPFLCKLGVPIKKAIGTSAAVGFPIALAATVGYVVNGWGQYPTESSYGYVHWPAALMIAVSSACTAPIGAQLAHHLPVSTLRRIFSLFILILALAMLKAILE